MSNKHPIFAVMDLGSNSFQLCVSEYRHGQLHRLYSAKQFVQLSRDFDPHSGISSEAQTRALDCLRTFKKVLDSYPSALVRAVGTQIFRAAKNIDAFQRRAEQCLQQSIEILSSEREGQLAYFSVTHNIDNNLSCLVIDTGGASTEFILGVQQEIKKSRSLALGCVSLAKLFFKDKSLTQQAFDDSYQFCQHQLKDAIKEFSDQTWDIVIGASGTLQMIIDLAQDQADFDPHRISRVQLKEVIDAAIKEQQLPTWLNENLRFDVLPAGLSLLLAIMNSFGIDDIVVTDTTLIEGLMMELLQA